MGTEHWAERLVENVVELAMNGASCSESFQPFATQLGWEESRFRGCASPMAGGVGMTGGTCGVVAAGLMLLGYAVANEAVPESTARQRTMVLSMEYADSFAEATGSTLCCELCGKEPVRSAEGMKAIRESGQPLELIKVGAHQLAVLLGREGLMP